MHLSQQRTTFLTNTCNIGYKKCLRSENSEVCGHLMQKCFETKEFEQPEPVFKYKRKEQKPLVFDEKDNKINLRRCKKEKFYDASICRHLCSSSLVLKSRKSLPTNSCEDICFELTKSAKSAGEICPFQKYCPNGCPCQFYQCEKISGKEQEKIPVWDLYSQTERKMTEQEMKVNIFQRREALDRKPNTSGFNVMLHDFNSTNSSEVFVQQDAIFPHERIKIVA